MQEKLNQLRSLLGEVADLGHIMALMEWDQETYMPEGAVEARSRQLATIGKLMHIKATSDEIGTLLADLKPWADTLAPDDDNKRLIAVTARDYDKEKRIPPDFVAQRAQVTSMARHAWMEARAKSDFKIFQPHLEKILALNHRYVAFFPPAAHPYDVLLDDYEPGMTTAEVEAIFDTLRPQQVDLIQAVAASPQVDDRFLHLEYDEQKQWDFGLTVISRMGYDRRRGRLDKSAHPFTTSFSADDVRITTRFEKNMGVSALFSSMHEAGHGLYDQGIGATWSRTPVANGASLAVHESQSRLWENIIGRSRPFWQYFFPRFKALFPDQLDGVSPDRFYRAINKVEPSLIRVEADEATYNLHIMLRLELEIAMIDGSLTIKDLPEAWNAKMESYLGMVPPTDAEGVLQDIHWSMGSLGYFSTYALGNLISVQLWEHFKTTHPQAEAQIEEGDFSSLLSWLRKEVHQYGRKYAPQELVRRITGSDIDPVPYIGYLQAKYGEIYGLE